MVRAGETAVIGGLIRTAEIEYVSGVPILKTPPVIGALFRTTQKRTEKRELLIFVTPRIVRRLGGDQALGQAAWSSSAR
jgi:type II secretory pathway component HofQ